MHYVDIVKEEINKFEQFNLNTYPKSYIKTLENLSIYDFDEKALNYAVDKAQGKYLQFKESTAFERTEILLKASRILEEYRESMAELISFEAKKPIKFALQEVDRSIQTLKLAGIEASKLEGEYINLDVANNGSGRDAFTKYESIGVIYAMTPFNFPLNLALHKIGPAIAVGNSVIVKPSEKTPFSTYFMKYILEQSGLPEDVVQVVTGDGENVTDLLLARKEIKKLSFTGSVRVGKILKEKIGLRKLTLELGSTSPVYISNNIEESKIDNIVSQVVNGAFSYNGQVCISTQKVYVNEEIYETFIKKVVEVTEQLKYGEVNDRSTDYSDLIDDNSQSRLLEWIQEAKYLGADILTGGNKHHEAIIPTIITNTSNDMKICNEEIFGPILVVETINSDDVLNVLNNSDYGLNVGVFTSNLEEALYFSNHLDYGQVLINDVPTIRFDHMPYNGRRDSGYGTEGIKYAIREMSQLKMVSLKYA